MASGASRALRCRELTRRTKSTRRKNGMRADGAPREPLEMRATSRDQLDLLARGELDEPVRAQRCAEEIALHGLAARAADERELGLRLDAFGDDVEAELARDADDSLVQAPTPLVVAAGKQRAVDLQLAERETREVRKVRVSRAEVVDGQLHPHPADLLEGLDDRRLLSDRGRLGDLEHETAGRPCEPLEHFADPADEPGFLELERRDVDRHFAEREP